MTKCDQDKTRWAVLVAVVAATVFSITACRTTGPSTVSIPGAASFPGTTWSALLIDDESVRGRPSPSITFLDEGQAAGYAGCNRYRSAVHVAGTSMRFMNVSLNPTACEQHWMDQESRFLRALYAVRAYRIESARLVLVDGQNKPQLLMERTEYATMTPSSAATPLPATPYANSESVVATEPAMSGIVTVPTPGLANYSSLVGGDAPGEVPNARLLGVEFVTLTPRLGEYFGTERGVLVASAPANNIFLLEDGDIVLAVNDRHPVNASHAQRIFGSLRPGASVHLEVMRKYAVTNLQLILPP